MRVRTCPVAPSDGASRKDRHFYGINRTFPVVFRPSS